MNDHVLSTSIYLRVQRVLKILLLLTSTGFVLSVGSILFYFLGVFAEDYPARFVFGASIRVLLFGVLAGGNYFLVKLLRKLHDQGQVISSLATNENRLEAAVRGASEGLWDWDVKSGHVFYSERFKQMLGYEGQFLPEDISTFDKLLHPDDHEAIWAALDVHFETKNEFSRRFRLKTNSGEYRWFHSRGYAGFNEKDEPVRMTGLIRDVTEQVNLEEALREASRKVTGVTANSILESLAEFLTDTLQVQYVVIARLNSEIADKASMVVFRSGEAFLEPVDYELEGTPCIEVWGKKTCIHERSICQHYPKDKFLMDMGAESYAGVPLLDSQGRVIGLLTLIDTKPIYDSEHVLAILNLFANRAATTLERMNTEEQAAEVNERFRKYFELGLIGLSVTNADGKWIEVNDRLCEILGYSREAMLNEVSWASLTHPEDREVSPYERVKAGEIDSYEVRKRFVHKDGHVIHAWVTTQTVRNSDGTVNYNIGIIQDITERVRAAEQLSSSEARYHHFFSTPLIGTSIASPDGNQLDFNDEYCRILGYSREELSELNWMKLTHPEDLAEELLYLQQMQDGEIDEFTIQKRYINKGGEIVHASLSVNCIRNTEGEIEYTVALVRDITQNVKEAERRKVMTNELDHRVKNNLASVLSLAELSINASESLEAFADSFTGRIRAMASVHEQLASNEWKGVNLRGMIERTVQPFVSDDPDRLRLVGDDFMLSNQQTSALSMAIHELATNAAKYGALSVLVGYVEVEWTAVDEKTLRLRWEEFNGPPLTGAVEPGVGTNIIRGLIEYELHGQVEMDYRSEGVVGVLTFPISRRFGLSEVSANGGLVGHQDL